MTNIANTINKPIFLQNEQAGPLVFRDDASNVEIVWQGKGDNSGNDMQAVPVSFLNNVNFLRILNRGAVTLIDADEDVRAAVESQLASPILQRQAAAAAERKVEAAAEMAPLDRPEKNDYITIGCIGPSSRGQGNCGAEVPVREATKATLPRCAPSTFTLPRRHFSLRPKTS